MSYVTSRSVSGLTLALCLVGSTLLGASSSSASEARGDVTVAPRLFVQDAQAATAERKRGKRWKITLTGIDPMTQWFTDRPERDAGRQATQSFVDEWDAYGFTVDPPNAVIQHEDADAVAVELKNPRYNAENATLTYTAIIDPGSGKRLARKMTSVSLFIDDAGLVTTQLNLSFNYLAPESRVTVRLTNDQGAPNPSYASFYISGPDTPSGGNVIDAEGGAVSFASFMISPTDISFETGFPTGDEPGNFTMSVFIQTPPTVSVVALQVSAPAGAEVQAALADQQPQVVNPTPTLFSLTR